MTTLTQEHADLPGREDEEKVSVPLGLLIRRHIPLDRGFPGSTVDGVQHGAVDGLTQRTATRQEQRIVFHHQCVRQDAEVLPRL